MTIPAAIMDQLSDWVGTFLPGGSRLPPRHPIKVCVVMGLLGLISGWLTMGLGIAVGLLIGQPPPSNEHVVFLTAGALQALVVLVPWGLWLGLRPKWFALMLPCTFLANFACFEFIDQMNKGEPFLGLFLFGFLSGTYLAIAGQCATQRFRPGWMIATALISAIGTSFFMLLRDRHWLTSLLPSDLELPLIIAWFFSNLHTPSALCLGYMLWDWTVPPKFESAEKTEGVEPLGFRGEESDSPSLRDRGSAPLA